MNAPIVLLVVIAIALWPSEGMESIQCPNSSATGETKPLYLLALVPFPDTTSGAGWSNGLGTLPGAIVARNEINNSTNLLPGYHIELIVEDIEACSRTQAAIGLVNMIKYIINPPCRPVTAVIGLLCSSHTALVAPVAGHEEIGLIELSAANSPLFDLQNNSFPHLWRFLSTGIAYVDTIIAMMDRYGWSRIAVVHDHGSSFFRSISSQLEKRVKADTNKSIVFNYASLLDDHTVLINEIINDIKHNSATVLLVALNGKLSARLFCETAKQGYQFPAFSWLQISVPLETVLLYKHFCSKKQLLKAVNGRINLEIQSSVTLPSFDQEQYVKKYEEELAKVRIEYNSSLIYNDTQYSTNLYDQVWSFALVLNQSLPVLEKRNLSIDNYTIGQLKITNIIEQQLAMLKVQKGSKFNKKKAIMSTVNIYQSRGSNDLLVGNFSPYKNTNSTVTYELTLVSFMTPLGDPKIKDITMPIPWAVTLYTLSGLTAMYISTILFLLLYYRNKCELKAFSPHVSVLILIGCYFITLSVIILVSTDFQVSDKTVYKILFTLSNSLTDFGSCLIYSVLALKILRVVHIFTTWRVKCALLWRDGALILYSLLYSMVALITLLNLLSGVLTVTIKQETIISNEAVSIHQKMIPFINNAIPTSIIVIVEVFTLFMILCFSILTRKIKRQNFKDTKKVNILLALVVSIDLAAKGYAIILNLEQFTAANILYSFDRLVKANLVISFLFLPKFFTLFCKKNS